MKTSLFCLFLLTLLIKINSTESNDIKFIISATLNGTSPFVSLLDLPSDEKYLYFTFDFNYHFKIQKKYRNVVYFLIDTLIDFQTNDKSEENSICFGFSNKKWNEITVSDLENIKFSRALIVSKKKPFNEFQYQIKIKTPFLKGGLTLVLRVPRLGYNTGYFSIQNILKLLKNKIM